MLGICNVVGSTIARESDGGVYVHSGPEIAVASTKAFTSQLAAFYLLTLLMARMHDMIPPRAGASSEALEVRAGEGAADPGPPGPHPGNRQEVRPGPGLPLPGPGPACIRWPWRARSSSRKSPTSTPRATPPGRSSTAPSP
ncbi:MAG: SIS domain-containing protein [Ignavibacteriales bacterium]|nr:SIS domain-containing protein [Ignavibacteriales bacterium]